MTNNIFKNKPKQWGLRGDPLFWDELEKHQEEIKKVSDIPKLVYKLYKEKTGEELTPSGEGYVETFQTTGMSSGYVSGEWWIETGIPLLIERYLENK